MEPLPPIHDKNIPRSCEFLYKWLSFTNYNQFIENVDIIPFKCPLQEKFDQHLEKQEQFNFKKVYDFSVAANKPITDVIDLTFTDKYYNPKRNTFYPPGVVHHKFKIPGKQVPKPEQMTRILDTMDDLIKARRVIGVHCTHGINRTGFIICSFLVQRLLWRPEDAISAFKKARGHEMAHNEYIDAVLALKVAESETQPLQENADVSSNNGENQEK